VQGTVVLAAIIDKTGQVTELKAKKGHPMLVPAAIEAVSKWRYKPYLLGGKPTAVATDISIHFSLSNPAPPPAAAASSPPKPVPTGKPASTLVPTPAPSLYGETHFAEKGVTAPRAIFSPHPDYTEKARKAGLEGTVQLSARIGEDGRVGDVYVLQSLGMGLDEKAIDALRKWKFEPARKDGKPVPVDAKININFTLN
jgi:TonB family protein